MYSFLRAFNHEDRRSRNDYRNQTVAPTFAAECNSEHSCYRERCQRVVINVAGELFETQLKTLDRYPNTLLGDHVKRSAYWDPLRSHYFFDRHRPSFPAILNFYQTGGKLRRPPEVPEEIFYDELKFFEVEESVIRDFLLSEGYSMRTVRRLTRLDWRTQLYSIFEFPDSSLAARIVGVFSVLVIVLSVALFCIETIPPRSPRSCVSKGSAWGTRIDWALWRRWLFILEAVCVLWFTIEFIVRLATSPYPPRSHLISLMNWLDVASIVPFIVSTIVLVLAECDESCARRSFLLRVFRFLRILRIFKLYKYVTGMQILGKTLRMSFREMTMFMFFLGVCIVLFATAIYFAETGNSRLQFNSIPDSFWWAVISMCTVGYGDYVPRSLPGKLVGGICVVAGVMTIALPVPVIVTNFNTVYRQATQRRMRPEIVQEKLIPE